MVGKINSPQVKNKAEDQNNLQNTNKDSEKGSIFGAQNLWNAPILRRSNVDLLINIKNLKTCSSLSELGLQSCLQ